MIDSQTCQTRQTDSTPNTLENDPTENLHDLSLHVPSITNSPRCAPARTTHSPQPAKPQTPRRVRPVRVDAWAVPASANWSRARTSVLKVGRGTRSTDWALPF